MKTINVYASGKLGKAFFLFSVPRILIGVLQSCDPGLTTYSNQMSFRLWIRNRPITLTEIKEEQNWIIRKPCQTKKSCQQPDEQRMRKL